MLKTGACVDLRAAARDVIQSKTGCGCPAGTNLFVQQDLYELGKTTGDFHGVTLPVYDRERTICDCFKYRSRLDTELFSKALNAYANDPQKNLSKAFM